MIEIGIQALCRNRKFAIQNTVFVGFLAVAISGVKVWFHFFGHLNPDVFRETLVQGIGYFFAGDAGVCVKDSYISQSVHTSICTAGADGLDFFAQKIGKGIIKYTLHCNSIRLCLPAAVIGSIVCYNKSNSFHNLLLVKIPSPAVSCK